LTCNFGKGAKVESEKLFELFASIAASSIRRVQYYEETRDALLIRDNFLSIISHEIRTPLTVINGYFELIKKRLERGEGIQQAWVDKGRHEADKIVKKIKELVDANDIQCSKKCTGDNTCVHILCIYYRQNTI
jgi:K+-sensing histidine kinase KdpD